MNRRNTMTVHQSLRSRHVLLDRRLRPRSRSKARPVCWRPRLAEGPGRRGSVASISRRSRGLRRDPAVKTILDRSGDDELPAIVVGGKLGGTDAIRPRGARRMGRPRTKEVGNPEMIGGGQGTDRASALRSAQAANLASSSTTTRHASSMFRRRRCAKRSGSAKRSNRHRPKTFWRSPTNARLE